MQQMLPYALELVGHYGTHALSFFAFQEENLRYIANEEEGLVSYRLHGNVAMTLGDVISPPEQMAQVTQSFLQYCEQNDWSPAFYQATKEFLSLYQKLGLHCFKIGEEALLLPQTFTLVGSAMANVRTSCRRAEREGVSVRWYEGPLPTEVLQDASSLSQAWLKQKEGQQNTEMGFSMGRLNELCTFATQAEQITALLQSESNNTSYTPRFVTGIAYNGQGKACGLITFTPIYGIRSSISKHPHRWGWSLDTMRRAPDAPLGVIELLIVRAVECFRERGAEIISMGLVAMADTQQEMTAQQLMVAKFVSEHSQTLASHHTLFKFKQKFHPLWESRYIVTDTMLDLPVIALALLRLHQGKHT
jgi:phosphatidylglycerol lysyltransferase